jgi:hypothetical protein
MPPVVELQPAQRTKIKMASEKALQQVPGVVRHAFDPIARREMVKVVRAAFGAANLARKAERELATFVYAGVALAAFVNCAVDEALRDRPMDAIELLASCATGHMKLNTNS